MEFDPKPLGRGAGSLSANHVAVVDRHGGSRRALLLSSTSKLVWSRDGYVTIVGSTTAHPLPLSLRDKGTGYVAAERGIRISLYGVYFSPNRSLSFFKEDLKVAQTSGLLRRRFTSCGVPHGLSLHHSCGMWGTT